MPPSRCTATDCLVCSIFTGFVLVKKKTTKNKRNISSIGLQVRSCSIFPFLISFYSIHQNLRLRRRNLYTRNVTTIGAIYSSLNFLSQPRERGRMRFHKLQNVQIALDFLKYKGVSSNTMSLGSLQKSINYYCLCLGNKSEIYFCRLYTECT